MNDATASIGFEHRGIGAVLSQNIFVVPLNQREYSWKEEHVVELFTDLTNAKREGPYFLGTIVITRGGRFPEVCDGQQRLATTTIFLAAIRDYLYLNDNKLRADQIEADYLKKLDTRTGRQVQKLSLNVDDNEFFARKILERPDSPLREIVPSRPSHNRILKASEVAAKHVMDLVSTLAADKKAEILIDWEEFLRDKAEVIVLKVPDHINAFVMFETLNDRGLEASQADLLKNFLLSQVVIGEQNVVDRTQEAQQKWAQMLGTLDSIDGKDVTVTFLHHLLIALHGPTRLRDLFQKVKTKINSQPRAIEFLDSLASGAQTYTALFNPSHAYWNEYGDTTRGHIRTLADHLKVEQIRPLMFSVITNFPVADAKEAIRLFVCWCVRFLIVGGGGGGKLERYYGEKAHAIHVKQIRTVKELAAAMNEVVPSDAVFETAFAEARVSTPYLARYYLRALERTVKGESSPEFVENDNKDDVNLEHILPVNPGTNWPGVSPEAATVYYKAIGNMALMKARANVNIGNSPFDVKKEAFAGTSYKLTEMVTEYAKWGPEEIVNRQKRMAQYAVATWPITIAPKKG